MCPLRALLDQGLTPVLFTSRGELRCASEQEGRRLSCALAELMGRLAAALAPDLGYLISKGGITTQTLLARGLALESVQLEGQLLPGLSLVGVVLTEECFRPYLWRSRMMFLHLQHPTIRVNNPRILLMPAIH